MTEPGASAETTYADSDYDATLDQPRHSDVAALPVHVLDRTLPLMLTSVAVEKGDTRARRLLAELERALRCNGPVVGAILTRLAAETSDDPLLRASLARAAVTVLRRTDEAPIALHRALRLLTTDRSSNQATQADLPTASTYPALAALTAREREVALAASQGASNRMIAEDSQTSVRTVETQLSSIYRKLGIGSRHQLTALVGWTADDRPG